MNLHVETNYLNKTQIIPPTSNDIKKNEELILVYGIVNF